MQFNFVLIAFAAFSSPPRAIALKNAGLNYRFAPLSDAGVIFTADFDLWSTGRDADDAPAETFCPSRSAITQAILKAGRENCHFLMALTQHAEYEPPGSPDVRLKLESASQIIDKFSGVNLTELGFDIIDQWTGISALANIGYGADKLVELTNMQLSVNRFGLFDKVEDASKFLSFAVNAAPEHAPYIPVKIIVQFPTSK